MLKTIQTILKGRDDRARKAEQGNVLFLILIAVALFAALSYAVTQSSRSGGGGTDGESNLVNSAQLTQYPASVRTAVVRMMINGIDASQLEFNVPSDFSNLTDVDGRKKYGVFHPDGGGATYVTSAPNTMASSAQGTWIFSSAYQVEDIGTTAAASSANEIMALLPGVAKAICTKLNAQLGIAFDGTTDTDGDGVPEAGASTVPGATESMIGPAQTGIGAYAAARKVGGTAASASFDGQPFGCADFGTSYVYYHVLVER